MNAEHWGRRLAELADKYGVPGAAFGVLRLTDSASPQDDERIEVAHGVLSTATGVRATPDSLFQIASLTKSWTATAAAWLADSGALDLDRPIADLLPGLPLGDLTPRQLLSHTSGLEGDVYFDTGPGDDCLARYAARLGEIPRLHRPGELWSYSNAGYVLAGRVIEAVTGLVWEEAMRELLFRPLGLTRTVVSAAEAVLHRVAVGHRPGPDGLVAPVAAWRPGRFCGPGGGIACSVGDLLSFARLHLTGGLIGNGRRILGEASVEDMRTRRADLPGGRLNTAGWGTGLMVDEWEGHPVAGHNGEIAGQSALFWLCPEQGLAVALLCNAASLGAEVLADRMMREAFETFAGIAMPAAPAPPARPWRGNGAPTGLYERYGSRLEVVSGAQGPALRREGEDWELVPVDDGLFLTRPAAGSGWLPVTFLNLGGTRFLHLGGRAHRAVAT
ncbi:serine hydrolase domain-containing protein [Microtetraspora malaysiensis]|uniref:Serine hydrolase domain-containing protein n=1 Tax=Microtetraspora malaysiensis TaxID=161358 RepID=A0ABW6T1R4_9ACTN